MKYKNVKFDLFFMICSLHLLGLPPPKKFKIEQNSRIFEAWKLYVVRIFTFQWVNLNNGAIEPK